MTRSTPVVPWRALSVLLAVNAALAGLLTMQLLREPSLVLPPVAAEVSGQAAATGGATDALPSLAPLASYAAMLERPLFLPGRRPFARPKAAVPPPPPPGGVPTLKGVVVTAERAVAMFLMPDASQYVFGEIGSTVGSWKIEEIVPGGVRLRRGAVERLLVLEDRVAQKPGPGARPDVPGSAEKAGPADEAQPRVPQ